MEKQFTLDGDPVDIQDFVTVNDLDGHDIREINNLKPGDRLRFGVVGSGVMHELKRVK